MGAAVAATAVTAAAAAVAVVTEDVFCSGSGMQLDAKGVTVLRKKIIALLGAAHANGATKLVLSALGCGAFKNPPEHVAALFKEALLGRFSGCFEHVVFAIFDDHNARKAHNPDGNLAPFQRIFHSM